MDLTQDQISFLVAMWNNENEEAKDHLDKGKSGWQRTEGRLKPGRRKV